MKNPEPTTRDREIAERIMLVPRLHLGNVVEVREAIATILAAERDERMERVHKLLNELATNSTETIVLLYVNRIREELK